MHFRTRQGVTQACPQSLKYTFILLSNICHLLVTYFPGIFLFLPQLMKLPPPPYSLPLMSQRVGGCYSNCGTPCFSKSFPGKWQRALFVCVTCAYTLCGPAPAKPSWLCYDCSQNAPASSFHPLPLLACLCRLSSDLDHRLTSGLGKRKKPRFGLTSSLPELGSVLPEGQ